MAEIIHHRRSFQHMQHQHAPSAQGPPYEPPERQQHATAGPGRSQLVMTSGIRHKQLEPFVGATEEALKRQAPINNLRASISKYTAGPYQKDAAVRAAERAIRPWSAYAGMGERRGAALAQAGEDIVRSYGQPDAPSLFYPNAAAAEAFAQAATRVARAGQDQVISPHAWQPISHQFVGRELWPRDIVDPPKYCAGCRSDQHDPGKERNPAWEPYTPKMRLQNLHALHTKFQHAVWKHQLCVALDSDSRVSPIRWVWLDTEGNEMKPNVMTKEDFIQQMVLFFDGLREGHEPYRYLATHACHAFLDTHSPHILEAAAKLVQPIKLGLNTMEPHLIGHMLLMLQKLIMSHPAMGKTLTPHFKHFLPVMAFFHPRQFTVHLPPPFCTAPAGSFAGTGCAPVAAGRSCTVCGAPIDKENDSLRALEAERQARDANPHRHNDGPLLKPHVRHPIKGRRSKKYQLSAVIGETLQCMVEHGGKKALVIVQNYVPRFNYYNPKD